MNMKQLFDEFKIFIMKGNVIDLAVGVIIGAAFKTIVDSMVGDIITPIVKILSRQAAPLDFLNGIAKFLGAGLNFLMIAAIVFFVLVKPINKFRAMMAKKEEEKPAEPAPAPEDIKLLTEIRDLLKKQSPR